MNRSRWHVTAVATALGVALAGPSLAKDPKPGEGPVKAVVKVAPVVKQFEVPPNPPVNGSYASLQLVGGQSYKVKVTYTNPYTAGRQSTVGAPTAPPTPVASTGGVTIEGGNYSHGTGKYEFTQKYSIAIPPVKPGDSVTLETPVFRVPANLGLPCCAISVWKPTQ